jgi:hypothetical protein
VFLNRGDVKEEVRGEDKNGLMRLVRKLYLGIKYADEWDIKLH